MFILFKFNIITDIFDFKSTILLFAFFLPHLSYSFFSPHFLDQLAFLSFSFPILLVCKLYFSNLSLPVILEMMEWIHGLLYLV